MPLEKPQNLKSRKISSVITSTKRWSFLVNKYADDKIWGLHYVHHSALRESSPMTLSSHFPMLALSGFSYQTMGSSRSLQTLWIHASVILKMISLVDITPINVFVQSLTKLMKRLAIWLQSSLGREDPNSYTFQDNVGASHWHDYRVLALGDHHRKGGHFGIKNEHPWWVDTIEWPKSRWIPLSEFFFSMFGTVACFSLFLM